MEIVCPSCGKTFEITDKTLSPLRNARLKKRASIAEAANSIGMSHWALSRLERGEGNPKLSVLKKIAKYYDRSIVELFPEPESEEEEADNESEETE